DDGQRDTPACRLPATPTEFGCWPSVLGGAEQAYNPLDCFTQTRPRRGAGGALHVILNTHRAVAVPRRGAPSPAARAARINVTEKWIEGGEDTPWSSPSRWFGHRDGQGLLYHLIA